MIIAIDGPAGTGKSTIAKILADKLNLTFLNSGGFYRTLTLAILDMEANMDKTVVFTIFVASSVPPMPVSSTTMSHFFLLKYKKASAVSISKAVGCSYPFSHILSQAFFTSSKSCVKRF